MSFKLLALDLDDTLLNEEFVISEKNKKAIHEAIRKGVTVTLATGRMFRSTLPYAQQLELDVPLITYHGALVKTARTQEQIFHCPVPLQAALEIIDLLEENGNHLNLYLNDELFVREDNEMIRLYVSIADVDYQSVGNLREFLKVEPTKMTMISSEEDTIKSYWNLFSQKYKNQLKVVPSKPYFLEITNARATKGQALKALADSLGVKREEVIAIGDSYNDIDMLEYAGLGVAVENAREDVKKAADYITASNINDGVTQVINKYILR
ncbi:Cof-type HAD-IIB family hydrolase [Candidatus Contubernalis alkaliaceticus]|uniref:Cof-type HAD-IIB family hydrolase n=1 Tax=Candidatus Contubernalis alkaliaceticus TaxID=338645 RepID=UPI001F4BF5DB|nr:Cof-type HAD-IIB family hydrolase [Candidatus Contubernalis alkalaceticus]UNC90785.1 HAD family phosphatase [Candidatus Contubernalis alkalaceticus]